MFQIRIIIVSKVENLSKIRKKNIHLLEKNFPEMIKKNLISNIRVIS